MVFDAKKTLDCILRGEGVATCLMKCITVAVFKVSSISLFVSLIVLISCSHKYNLIILVTAKNGIFVVTNTLIILVSCSHKHNPIILATATNGIFAVANTLVVVVHCSQKYNLSILVTAMYNYLLILTV